MIKKGFIFVMMFMYLYTLTFNIFMTAVFRIPTPLIFGIPLIFLFAQPFEDKPFLYTKEVILFFFVAAFLFLFSLEDIPAFFSFLIVSGCCALYFNFFVGRNLQRLKTSVIIFYAVLLLSGIVMLLNHRFPAQIDALRAVLVGDIIFQSPSGISTSVFAFGYQLAALCSFLIVAAIIFKKNILLVVLATVASLVLIFYGMNRSSLVVVAISVGIFLLLYFRLKAALIFALLGILIIVFSSSIESFEYGRQQNILAKNEKKNSDENRGELMIENLKIIADYPFGITFYGKTWNHVARYNPIFKVGESGLVTSHNAYLMFITYIGIIPGIVLLWLMFRKILKIFWFGIVHIKNKKYRLLIALCFSFIAISMNAVFHNEWLLQQGAASLFLYFCILHLAEHQLPQTSQKKSTERTISLA